MNIVTKTAEETQVSAKQFAQDLLKKPATSAAVLALRGNLGAGKTTFLQGFAKGLGIEEIVNSPTFVIMKKFQIPRSTLRVPRYAYFYHFDLYRLEDQKDFEFFDFKSILENPQNIVAIEWPEKISDLLPSATIYIDFSHEGGDNRGIVVK